MAKKRNKIAIISRESDNKSLDIQLLEQELLGRGLEVETMCRLLEKKVSISSLAYLGHMFKQQKLINESKVLILDTYCMTASMLPQHKGLKTIQMWHALSAIKKFGWQTVGYENGTNQKTAELMKMHRGYDKVVCCSDVTAHYFCEAFRITPDKIVKKGLPRIDYILKEDKPIETEIRQSLQLPADKQIILYAPTFHKGQTVDVRGLAEALDPDKYCLVVKLHPLYRVAEERVSLPGVIYDDSFNTYDVLRVADIVISDYSSFVVEASLANKPLYLYIYDNDEYKRKTGLNMDFTQETIGKYAFTDASELAVAMQEPYDYQALSVFRQKYIDIDTNNCTAQLADYIESLLD